MRIGFWGVVVNSKAHESPSSTLHVHGSVYATRNTQKHMILVVIVKYRT